MMYKVFSSPPPPTGRPLLSFFGPSLHVSLLLNPLFHAITGAFLSYYTLPSFAPFLLFPLVVVVGTDVVPGVVVVDVMV